MRPISRTLAGAYRRLLRVALDQPHPSADLVQALNGVLEMTEHPLRLRPPPAGLSRRRLVLALHLRYPEWPVERVADEARVSRNRVYAYYREAGISLPWGGARPRETGAVVQVPQNAESEADAA